MGEPINGSEVKVILTHLQWIRADIAEFKEEMKAMHRDVGDNEKAISDADAQIMLLKQAAGNQNRNTLLSAIGAFLAAVTAMIVKGVFWK